jgi:hypothetical protein
VGYAEDWCGLSDAASYVYHTYGVGGTCPTCGRDEVWVAPSDEILQYLVLRASVKVTREAKPGPRIALPTVPAPSSVVYQEGLDDYAGWVDTHISELHRWSSPDTAQELELRIGGGLHSSLLLSMDIMLPADPKHLREGVSEQAGNAGNRGMAAPTVVAATLGLYATLQSNLAGLELNAYPLLKAWDPAEANWLQASGGLGWDQEGARAAGFDRATLTAGSAHVEGCWDPSASAGERWYTFDVTDWVTESLASGGSYGLVIEGAGSASKGIFFASSEYYKAELRPKLVVHYEWPLPDPTPTITPSPTPTSTPRPRLLFPMVVHGDGGGRS